MTARRSIVERSKASQASKNRSIFPCLRFAAGNNGDGGHTGTYGSTEPQNGAVQKNGEFREPMKSIGTITDPDPDPDPDPARKPSWLR